MWWRSCFSPRRCSIWADLPARHVTAIPRRAGARGGREDAPGEGARNAGRAMRPQPRAQWKKAHEFQSPRKHRFARRSARGGLRLASCSPRQRPRADAVVSAVPWASGRKREGQAGFRKDHTTWAGADGPSGETSPPPCVSMTRMTPGARSHVRHPAWLVIRGGPPSRRTRLRMRPPAGRRASAVRARALEGHPRSDAAAPPPPASRS